MRQKFLAVGVLAIALIIGFFVLYWVLKRPMKPQIIAVDNNVLLRNFNMTKDLKRITEIKLKTKKKTIDSLYFLYGNEKNLKKQEYLEKQLRTSDIELQKLENELVSEADRLIKKRLKEYIRLYALEKNIGLIVGFYNDDLGLIYQNDPMDHLSEIIEYVNTKYEGQ